MRPFVIENLSISYAGQPVIQDFGTQLPDKGYVRLKGPSGCGKTTLLQAIAGLKEYTGTLDTGLEEGERLAYVFQDDRLLPWYSAKDNVALAVNAASGKHYADESAQKWLAKLGLSDALDKHPAELSGGMRQRVNIARALAYDARILLLDEPYKGLDPELKYKVSAIFEELSKEILIILVSHEEDGSAAGKVISL